MEQRHCKNLQLNCHPIKSPNAGCLISKEKQISMVTTALLKTTSLGCFGSLPDLVGNLFCEFPNNVIVAVSLYINKIQQIKSAILNALKE